MLSDRAAHFAALSDDVRAFRHYIQAERGLAANTLLAYGRDLDRFCGWVAGGGLADYLAPSLRDLSHYLEFLRAEGLAPPSIARHLVSLKMFYRFLRLEERTTESTVELLSSPALWERIPHVLSPESIVKLLEAPRPLDRFFLRDRAILETHVRHRRPGVGGGRARSWRTPTWIRGFASVSARGASSASCRWAAWRSTPCAPTWRAYGRA